MFQLSLYAEDQPPDNPVRWAEVVANCEKSGISIEQILATIRLCAEKQVPAEDAKNILDPVCSIKNDPVMHALLLEKVEEGISKDAPVSAVQAAIMKRRHHVAAAQRILSFNYTGEKSKHLVGAVTYALESGVPSLLLTKLIQSGHNLSHDKLKSFIESAEFLHLAGEKEGRIQELITRQMNP